jgi:hypothetical protein
MVKELSLTLLMEMGGASQSVLGTGGRRREQGCGEVALNVASNTNVSASLISTKSATGCGARLIYALSVRNGDSTDSVDRDFGFDSNGN